MRLKRLMALILTVALSSACRPVAESGGVKLAAAASLTHVLEELLDSYAAAGGGRVSLSVGGSDFLARQIVAGGDADVFISADTEWMLHLVDRGGVRADAVRTLCRGRLVLVTRPGSAFSLEGEPRGRLAMAEPETVPAGRYARQALQSLGLWEKWLPRMVWAGDVRTALAFVERGAVDAAIVYSTDAQASRTVRVAMTFEETLHEPILYPMAPVAGNVHPAASAELMSFLLSVDAQRVFARHGFEAPRR